MKSKFSYFTTSLGTWHCDSPRHVMIRILTPMVLQLQGKELEGTLEEDLCSLDCPAPHPRWVEDAERCRSKSFRDEGIAAAIELVQFVSDAPNDLEPFVRMASHGRVMEDVAAEFEPDIWVILNNYAFLRERHAREHGRDPVHFLHHAAEMLELAVEYVEGASDTCECCGEPIESLH